MIGIVVVSHSAALANAAVDLASQMTPAGRPAIACAAGLADGTLGTDATSVQAAIEQVYSPDGVLVLVDLGSAVLSAEMALEFLDPAVRKQVKISPAPLVEGLVAAVVTAAGGASTEEVAREAAGGLAGKQSQLGAPPADDGAPRPPAGRTTGVDEARPVVGDNGETAEFMPAPGPAPTDDGGLHVVFTLTNAHGLHARPAALLVAQARSFDADMSIRNLTTGSEWVSAASLTKVTTLGAMPGAELEVWASGPQAQRALNAVVDLAKGNFGEHPAAAMPPPQPPQQPIEPPPVLASPAASAGVVRGASPGLALGPARHLAGGELVLPDHETGTPTENRARLHAAIDQARTDLIVARGAAGLTDAEAAIFDAHVLMLDDPAVLGPVHEAIDGGQGAAAAWSSVMTALVDRIETLTDEYLRARAGDARGLRDHVLRHLLGVPPAHITGTGILIAADLVPAEVAALDVSQARGIVLADGSPTSHAAILARSKGIPMLTGAGPEILQIAEGVPVAIDGATGELVVDPSPEVVKHYRAAIKHRAAELATAATAARKPAITKDGVRVPVRANVASLADAEAAAQVGAEGSGLVRTEFVFADRSTAPTRSEQEEVYRDIAKAFDGQRVVIRTLDAGGDKPLDFLAMPPEDNPFLGVRGLRLSLQYPDVLVDQLVAICAVAEDYPVSVMFPMVSRVDELIAARRLLSKAATERGRPVPANLRIGIMIEVPTVALKAASFAPLVDFMSIGTNDLTQYAMAAERGNAQLADLSDAYDPGVLRLIGLTCRAVAGRAEVSVCGELAGDPDAVPILLGLGVRSLSASGPAIAQVKQRVRKTKLSKATKLAAKAMRAADAADVRALLS